MAGRFKPLLPVGGQTMIERTVGCLSAAAGVGRVLVVTGHRADEVRKAVGRTTAARTLCNEHYQTGGMVSSAQVGARALPPDADGFVLSLGDQPTVRPDTISHLIAAWRKGAATIAIPAYHGKRGHPIVMSADCIDAILKLTAGQTLKTVVERYKDRTIELEVDDPGVVTDVDTPDDYQQLLKDWDVRLSLKAT
jgi:CTP:molybdopterin cytidylyltransferase MocA